MEGSGSLKPAVFITSCNYCYFTIQCLIPQGGHTGRPVAADRGVGRRLRGLSQVRWILALKTGALCDRIPRQPSKKKGGGSVHSCNRLDISSSGRRWGFWPAFLAGALAGVLVLVLSGCGTAPAIPDATGRPAAPPSLGHRIVAEARELIGTPYRYGGATPHGFDCSGLVYYTHRRVGLSVPRSTRSQLEQARPVSPFKLRPGDLVFFRLSWRKVSHVGIYAGERRFIHAPSTGKRVSMASLDNAYWEKRLVAAGRFYGS